MIFNIKLGKNFVHDTWEEDWYVCPNCKFDTISSAFHYCPRCGEGLEFIEENEWEEDINEEV